MLRRNIILGVEDVMWCKYKLRYNCFVTLNWVEIEVIFGINDGCKWYEVDSGLL